MSNTSKMRVLAGGEFIEGFLSFFFIKKETKKSRLTDNFGNNVRLSCYILESILTIKTALNSLNQSANQETILPTL